MTAELEKDLHDIVNKGLAGTAQRSDLEALLVTGDTLLQKQLDKLSSLQSEYEISRVTTADDYRKQMDALRRTGEEALRNLDLKFRGLIAETEHTIEVIEAMRKAGAR